MDEIDKISIDEAKDLLSNIQTIGDLRNLKVRHPELDDMTKVSLQDWVKWLVKRMEVYGEYGVESQILLIIKEMDVNAQLVVERAKEGVRRIMLVLDKQEKEIELNKTEIVDLNSKNKLLEQQIKSYDSVGVEKTDTYAPEITSEDTSDELEIEDTKTEKEVSKNAIDDKLEEVEAPVKRRLIDLRKASKRPENKQEETSSE